MENIAPERKQLSNNNLYWEAFANDSKVSINSLVQYRSSIYRFLNNLECPLNELTGEIVESIICTTNANRLYVNSFLKFVFTRTDMRNSANVNILLWILSNGK